MISPKLFVDKLVEEGLSFFAGVPDSLLKNFCAYITDNIDNNHNIIAANEGGAIGLAAGHYLATGNPAVVYMQNSGEGNIINPLTSLMDKEVYDIPVLLIIGWRGKPGVHDEPQHIKQGKVTLPLLDVLGISYQILSHDEKDALLQLEESISKVKAGNIFALVIEKDTFDNYKLKKNEQIQELELTREEALCAVASSIQSNAVIVSTTGMISRELFEHRTRQGESHEKDFLTVGSMGHASQIALGIALEQPNRPVYCFDGDGASIMHMGNMAIIAQQHPNNFIHIVFNNGAHDSVGGQPTVGLKIDLPDVAKALGYNSIYHIETIDQLSTFLNNLKVLSTLNGPYFIEICVKKGNRKDLGRPTTTAIQNKKSFMNFIKPID